MAPHPHTGLQTESWLVAGEVTHRDSRLAAPPLPNGRLRPRGRHGSTPLRPLTG